MPGALKIAFSAGLALAAAASSAFAETPSLVGVWSHHVDDPRTGQYISVIWDEFSPDGRLHSKYVTPAGTIDLYGAYQVRGGVVRAVFNDWSPKQVCTLVCTRNPPPMQIGVPGDSPLRFAGPDVVYFGADMYTRHR
ncbi:MAG TPA: hypothetical protein VG227_01755 [Caulobacteraceae bacterium]|nr:hypothetical protein [Caulobacteraceae bacterium]